MFKSICSSYIDLNILRIKLLYHLLYFYNTIISYKQLSQARIYYSYKRYIFIKLFNLLDFTIVLVTHFWRDQKKSGIF